MYFSLNVDDKKATFIGSKTPKELLSFYKRFEGRKRFLKNGGFEFESTQHNISLWLNYFPNTNIIKNEEVNEFEEIIKDKINLRNKFIFKTNPYPHQRAGLEKFKNLSTIAILAEMGTGKSKLMIDIMGYKYCSGEIDAAIVLSPKGVHNQWVEKQIPEHMSDNVPVASWAWDKSKAAKKDYEEMLKKKDSLQIVTMNLDAIKTVDGFELLNKFIDLHKGKVAIVIDEAHNIKNGQAQRTKKALALGDKCKVRAIMTGSPIAKNITDMYSQYKFLSDKIIGTKYFTSFKSMYCEQRWNGFGHEVIGAKNLDKLYARIDPYTLRATKSELDLPPKIYDTYPFEMHDDQKKAYKEIKKQFMTEILNSQDKGEKISVTNAASAITRLQQISSGYLPKEDGTIHEFKNARLDALKALIENIEGKVIIWARFNHDIDVICKAFGKEAVAYNGKTSDDDRKIAVDKFLDPDSEVRFFVSNPEAGGTGLNLQGLCTTAIYYTNSYNAVSRWQSEDRIHRVGTKSAITYFDIVARGSVDTKILANLKGKKALSDLALDEVRKMFEDD